MCIVYSCSGVQKMSVYDRYLCLIFWANAPFGFIFILGWEEGRGKGGGREGHMWRVHGMS